MGLLAAETVQYQSRQTLHTIKRLHKKHLAKTFCIFKNDIEETLEEKFTKSSVRLEVFADNLQF